MSSIPPTQPQNSTVTHLSRSHNPKKENIALPINKSTKKRTRSKTFHPYQQNKHTPFRQWISIQPRAKSWHQTLKDIIRPLLLQTTYGKNLAKLLSSEQNFSAAQLTDHTIRLNNYNTVSPADCPPFKGVCNELALSMANYLKQQFGSNLTIQMVRGTCQDYYPQGIHYYLLMWPSSQDDAMNGRLRASQNLPELALVVDPSFRRVFCPGESPQESQKYQSQHLQPLEGAFLQNISPHVILSNLPILLPIGFIKDLIPASTSSYGEHALLYLEYDKPSADGLPARITPMIQPDANSMQFKAAPECLNQINIEHPLNQFYVRLLIDLSPSFRPAPVNSAEETLSRDMEAYTDWILREWQTYQRSIPTLPLSPINPFQAALSVPTDNASVESEQQTASNAPLNIAPEHPSLSFLLYSPSLPSFQPPLSPPILFLDDSPQPETVSTPLPFPHPRLSPPTTISFTRNA